MHEVTEASISVLAELICETWDTVRSSILDEDENITVHLKQIEIDRMNYLVAQLACEAKQLRG